MYQCNCSVNFTGAGTEKFREFGISVVPNQENVILPELIKFYLYPKIDSSLYQNYTIQIGFRFYRYSIYYANHLFDDGFRVTDLQCYSKLVEFFRSIHLQNKARFQTSPNTIQVTTDMNGVQNVTTLGFISII